MTTQAQSQMGGNRAAITACVMLATLMQSLDTTIANVALPYMQGSVAASQDEMGWVLTSYIVAAAIMTPATGYLAGRFGIKRVLLTSVAGFVFASMLCGLAQSLVEIVLFRVLQGIFGAALGPLFGVIIADYYLVKRQMVTVNELYSMSPTAQYFYDRGWNRNAVIALALSSALSIGLALLGAYGLLINVGDWGWLIGACAAAAAYRVLCSASPPTAELTLAGAKQPRGATP